MRLMEESHQNTPENEIQMHKQKHPIYIASGFLKTSVGKLPKKMTQNNKTSKSKCRIVMKKNLMLKNKNPKLIVL